MYLSKSTKLRVSEIEESKDYQTIKESLAKDYFVLVFCQQSKIGYPISVNLMGKIYSPWTNINTIFQARKVFSQEVPINGWIEVISPIPLNEDKDR